MFIKFIIQFILGLGVGVYGYLAPSYLNLSVLQLGLGKNKIALWKVVTIISLVEIPYCYICLQGMQWIMQQHTFLLIIKWLLVLILFLFALLTLKNATKKQQPVDYGSKTLDSKQIKKLLLFAVFNPFQLSAWTIWGTYFIEKTWFSWTTYSIFIFSIGASIGVFIILWLYAFTGQKIVSYFSLNRKSIDYIVASILFILATIQFIKNL